MAILQNPTLLALVQAEEASQSQHVGLTVGELARLASDESQHEATESPIEAAFEAAEAAHNPGVSMLAPSRYGSLGDRDLDSGESARAPGAGRGERNGRAEVTVMAILQNPTLLALVQAEEASQSRRRTGRIADGRGFRARQRKRRSRPPKWPSKRQRLRKPLGCRCRRCIPRGV